jgi:hypothetical protein
MPTIFRASLALSVLPLLVPVLVACTSSNPTPDAGPGGQICPTTIVEATTAPGQEGVTSSCHVDDYICVVGFPCGNFTQQATCTCDGSNFSCVLSDGTQVQPGVTDPSTLCQSVDSDGGANPCPTDKTMADGTACSNVGQQCYYKTTCTTTPPPTDVCQCKGNTQGDAGLTWQCDLNSCP